MDVRQRTRERSPPSGGEREEGQMHYCALLLLAILGILIAILVVLL